MPTAHLTFVSIQRGSYKSENATSIILVNVV